MGSVRNLNANKNVERVFTRQGGNFKEKEDEIIATSLCRDGSTAVPACRCRLTGVLIFFSTYVTSTHQRGLSLPAQYTPSVPCSSDCCKVLALRRLQRHFLVIPISLSTLGDIGARAFYCFFCSSSSCTTTVFSSACSLVPSSSRAHN